MLSCSAVLRVNLHVFIDRVREKDSYKLPHTCEIVSTPNFQFRKYGKDRVVFLGFRYYVVHKILIDYLFKYNLSN